MKNQMIKNKKQTRQNSKNFFNQILFFLSILLLPTQLGKHFFFSFSYLSGVRVDYLAPTLYATDLIVILMFLLNIKTVILSLKNKWIFTGLLLLFINALLSLSPPIAFYKFLKIIEALTIITVIKNLLINSKLILIGFTITAIGQLILVILQLVYKHSIQGIFYFFGERLINLSMLGVAKTSLNGIEFLRPYGTFSHPNSMAGFYLLLYFFVLTNKKFSSYIILNNIFLLISSILILISFSKTAIIIFVAFNLIYFLKINQDKLCRICVVAKIFIILILSVIFLQAGNDPNTISKRVELINNSIKIIAEQPLMGVGLGNYLYAQNKFPSSYFDLINQPVHNIFLLLLSELGIISSFIFMFFVFNNTKKQWLFNNLLIVGVVITTGLVDHYWLTLQQNFLLLAVVLGLSL